MWRYVDLVWIDVSEERIASIFRLFSVWSVPNVCNKYGTLLTKDSGCEDFEWTRAVRLGAASEWSRLGRFIHSEIVIVETSGMDWVDLCEEWL
jgi:hypothetical protein